MKAFEGVEAKFHVFLISKVEGSEWSAAFISRFTPEVPIK
jgi:hypothetical protein